MASEQEIEEAVSTAREAGCKQLMLLHCISSYPAPIDQSNIKQIPNLAKRFDVITGLSDHTLGTTVSVAAIAQGASLIEKHFTLNRLDKGPDSEFSLEPKELKKLCVDTKDAWMSLGKLGFKRQKAEEASKVFRRSVYFVKDLPEGHIITSDDIRRIRPGMGLAPKYYKKILGKVLSVRCEIGKYLPSWRPDIDYTRSVSSKKELGGGVLLELSHELDYLNWIFGQVDWIRASLFTQSSLKINVEDTAHLILGLNSKEDSYNIIAAVNLDFIRHDNTRFCIAIGEDGTLRWDGITGEVLYYNKDSDEWIEMFVEDQKRDDSYISEWINFIDCISNKKKPVVSIEDGIKVLQIIGAAKKSFKTGKEVRINHNYQTKKVNQ